MDSKVFKWIRQLSFQRYQNGFRNEKLRKT